MNHTPIALTEESIQGYGALLHNSRKEPAANDEVFKWIPDIFKYDFGKSVTVGILTGKKRKIEIDRLERHKHTAEILVQLVNDAILFLSRPSEKVPTRDQVQAFELKCGHAVVLNEGVWHWIPFPVDDDCKTLIIYKDGTGAHDYESSVIS